MIAMMTIEVTRMSHMPHPPRWNAVEIVCNMIDLPPDAASLGRGGAENRGAPVQGQVQRPNDRQSLGSEGRGEARLGGGPGATRADSGRNATVEGERRTCAERLLRRRCRRPQCRSTG